VRSKASRAWKEAAWILGHEITTYRTNWLSPEVREHILNKVVPFLCRKAEIIERRKPNARPYRNGRLGWSAPR
jgi:hypothetical protein